MGHFSFLLQEAEEVKFENLSKEEKEQIDGFLSFEAKLFKDLAESVTQVNAIITSIAKGDSDPYSDNKDYKNYVSREDYKLFFDMSDENIDMWIYYATEIMRKPQLVKNMPNKSYIKMTNKKEKEEPK